MLENNVQDCNNCKQSILVGEITKRLDKAEIETTKIREQIATIREDNVSSKENSNNKAEDMKELKEINKGIFEILNAFKIEFVEIKQEMVFSKESRLETKVEIDIIKEHQSLMQDDIEILKQTPAKIALANSKSNKKLVVSTVVTFLLGVAVPVVVAILLHILVL